MDANVETTMSEHEHCNISFNVMTINMNGNGKTDKNADEVKKVIELATKPKFSCKPVIIFAQEIPPKWYNTTICNPYSHSAGGVTNKEAGLMWHADKFSPCSPFIDEEFKSRETFKVPLDCILCRKHIPSRLCAVLLQHKTDPYKVLAVSWHGPEKQLKLQKEDTKKEKDKKPQEQELNAKSDSNLKKDEEKEEEEEKRKYDTLDKHGPEKQLKLQKEDTKKEKDKKPQEQELNAKSDSNLKKDEEKEEEEEKRKYDTLDERKDHVLRQMEIYMMAIYKDIQKDDKTLKLMVIGGDFNLNLEDENISQHLVCGKFKDDIMSTRRENNKKKKSIDHFLVYPPNKIKVTECKPLDYRFLQDTGLDGTNFQKIVHPNGSDYIWHFMDNWCKNITPDYVIADWVLTSHQYVGKKKRKGKQILVVESYQQGNPSEIIYEEKNEFVNPPNARSNIQIRGRWPCVQIMSNVSNPVYIQMKSSPGQWLELYYHHPEDGWDKGRVNKPTNRKEHVVEYVKKSTDSQADNHTSVVIIANDKIENYLALPNKGLFKPVHFLDHDPLLASISGSIRSENGTQTDTENDNEHPTTSEA